MAWCSISVERMRSPTFEVLQPPAECDRVDRGGGTTGEDDLAGIGGADELGHSIRGRPRKHRWRPPRVCRRRGGHWHKRYERTGPSPRALGSASVRRRRSRGSGRRHRGRGSRPSDAIDRSQLGQHTPERIVSLLLEPGSQLRTAALEDLAIHEDMDPVRCDVVQKPLIVGDDEEPSLRTGEFVDARRPLCEGRRCPGRNRSRP